MTAAAGSGVAVAVGALSTAVGVGPSVGVAVALGSGVVQEYYSEEAKKVLEPAVASLEQQGAKAQTSWKVGPVGDTIAAAAEEGRYDMIIMGSHGHGSLARLVMGSVTTQVLAQCGVPVLLIR